VATDGSTETVTPWSAGDTEAARAIWPVPPSTAVVETELVAAGSPGATESVEGLGAPNAKSVAVTGAGV